MYDVPAIDLWSVLSVAWVARRALPPGCSVAPWSLEVPPHSRYVQMNAKDACIAGTAHRYLRLQIRVLQQSWPSLRGRQLLQEWSDGGKFTAQADSLKVI